MQLDAQKYLDMAEKYGKLYFVDTETSGREADYDKILVATRKQFGRKPESYIIGENASDRGLVKSFKKDIDKADCIVTFFGKSFDVPMINTRLTRWGYEPLKPTYHIDLFYVLKYKLKTGRRSQAHMLEFLHDTMTDLGIKPEYKMTVSPNTWADLWSKFHTNIRILRARCESDVIGLESLYRVTRHLIREIKIG